MPNGAGTCSSEFRKAHENARLSPPLHTEKQFDSAKISIKMA